MEDVEMENADTRPKKDETDRLKKMADFVNTRVFDLLAKKRNDDLEKKELLSARVMEFYVDKNTSNLLEMQLCGSLQTVIFLNYDVEVDVAASVAKEAAADAMKKYGVQLPDVPQLSRAEIKRLMEAFTETEYIGDASSQFKKYLERCWNMYIEDSPVYKGWEVFKAPYVAVVQSSGFGKSRMLYELARLALMPTSTFKVIYVCARIHKSTGYPVATEVLRAWLFPTLCTEEAITTRLKAIFLYAMDNWETVQTEWLELFTSTAADTKVKEKLEVLERKISSTKETRTLNSSSGKRVILVIDEARSLLDEGENRLSHFRLLRHALKNAITTNEGVFGVLIDTNSKVSDLTPPLSLDPSSRSIKGEELVSFPPFVLTHTMDVLWQNHCGEQGVQGGRMHDTDETVADMQDDAVEAAGEMVDVEVSGSLELKRDDVPENNSKPCGGKKGMSAAEIAYKEAVTGSEQDAWNALVRMGRPMWYSTFIEGSENQKRDVISLAANKLLLGLSPVTSNYMAHNMFGIASLLCRVGLRPYSTSSFASRAVADFMAILAYVNYEREGYVSSYASDPVLTLGAIKVWYAVEDALANFILPQLKKLILNEALDIGGIGEVVARIVLLLAMDKCVVGTTNYTGQFIPVGAFLETFGVDEVMPVFTHGMRAATDDTEKAFRTWLSQWDGWRMGFTHFVQLKLQPTEETLWYLLGRRAAGVFPRNQKGADLLIPIFWKKTSGASSTQTEDAVDARVSVILIQVKNRTSRDSGFPNSAMTKLCPSFVFGGMFTMPEVPDNNSQTEKPAMVSNEESVEGQPMEGVEGPSIKNPVEDSRIEELVENPLSKKSVRDVVCIYMNVQEESSQHHRFVYAKKIEDENKSNDGSGRPKAHDKKPRTGNLEAVSSATASGSIDNEAHAASELMFTLCYRSLRGDTYKFLDEKVAVRLVGLMETLWDPLVLVAGDLKQRQEVEDRLRKDKIKAVLSRVMGDNELMTVACKGFADPPGLHKPVNGQDDKSKKRRR